MEKAEEKLELITKYFADFSPVQLQQLKALDGLYKDWNSKINVISRKDEDSLYEKHILHSLSIAAAFDLRGGMKVLDLGTGGGFPGIPLAIFFPEVKFFLADSIGKKIKVVQAVAEAIGLKNVEARQVRAEEIKDRKFEVVVSRAVAPLGELWSWSKEVLKGEGRGERGEGRAEGRRQEADNGNSQKADNSKSEEADNSKSEEADNGNSQKADNNKSQKPDNGNNQEADNSNNQKADNGNSQKAGNSNSQKAGNSNNQTADNSKSQKEYISLPVPNGLICLKGGDLTEEIAQSGCKPRIMEVHEIFREPSFKEKYILYVPFKS